MTLTIHSGEKIPAETMKKIADIFAESNCPNESLINQMERWKDGKMERI